MGLVTAGILCCRSLQEYPPAAVTTVLLLGTAGILCGCALQGYLVVGHCRDTLRLALQGYVAIERCRDTWWLGTAGILGG